MNTLLVWLPTFALHGTLVLGAVWLCCLLLGERARTLQEHLLRHALWLPLLSTTLQCTGLLAPLELVELPPIELPRAMTFEAVSTAPPAIDLPASAPTAPERLAEALPWPWLLAGTALALGGCGLCWLLRTWWRLRAVLRDRTPETDGRVLGAAATLARGLGLRQSPHVSRSDLIGSPIAFGWWRPEICLPARAATLSDSSLRALLAHELCHLRRRDPFWMWLALLLQALFPWQPLLFAARRRWQQLIELRCDAVAATHSSQTAVARCLLDVAEWLQPAPRAGLALPMAAHRSLLRERIEVVLRGDAGRTELPLVPRLLGSGATLSALLLLVPSVEIEAPGPPADPTTTPVATAPAAPPPDLTGTATGLDVALEQLRRDHDELTAAATRLEAELRRSARSPQLLQQLDALRRRLLVLDRLRLRLEAAVATPEPPAAR